MTQREIHHLLWRAGFGPHPAQKISSTITKQKLVDQIFDDSLHYTPIAKQVTVVDSFSEFQDMSEMQRETFIKQSGQNIMNIGHDWLKKMVSDKAQLRERMVLFWHDHFASNARWDTLIYNQNELLRKHALGSFRELLHAMCHDAMLLKYLDNHRNNKGQPNENFTRELLELFTLGEGHYTEDDIKEGAKAFTGHAFNFKGEYLFKINAHDYGVKTFMGKSGRFKATDIIDIVLEQKQTAQYITEKIYRYFVNTTINEDRVNQLATDFFNSDYDISKLLRQIFESEWFYSPEHIGQKIKSPLDLLAGLMRQCNVSFNDDKLLLVLLKTLGQLPFHPPNVAGWPIGHQWLDSSTLLFRMRMADYLFLGQKINQKLKDPLNVEEDAFNDSFYENNEKINFDLSKLCCVTNEKESSARLKSLYEYIMQVDNLTNNPPLENWIENDQLQSELIIMNLFRLPEYQLC